MAERNFAVVQNAPMRALEIEARRVLDSPCFQRSQVISRLLLYLVRMTLECRQVKAFEIATDCLGRDGRESAESEGYARVAVARLRKVLANYYKEGSYEYELAIEPGSYAVRLRSRENATMAEFDLLEPPQTGAASKSIFFPETQKGKPDLPHFAKLAYLARGLRYAVFEDYDLFGEPAWDMLLILASATTSGEQVTVNEACKNANASPSTLQRWLSILEKRGFVEPGDYVQGQEPCLRLSSKGQAKMEEYLRAMQGLVGQQPASPVR